MNNAPDMPIDRTPSGDTHDLVQAALDALRESTGIEGYIVDSELPIAGRFMQDAAIELSAGGQSFRYWVESKRSADRRILLAQVKNQMDQCAGRGLLVVPHLSAGLADECRRLGLQFIDAAGNAFVSNSGLYVYIAGRKPSATSESYQAKRAGGRSSALRIVFALLCEPRLVTATYREIVEATGVALGAVGKVFDDLCQRGFVTAADAAHGRRLLEPARLLEEWVALYPSNLRPKLNPTRFRALAPDWWQAERLPSEDAWWGGEVATDRLLKNLKPASQTIYIAPAARAAVQKQLVATHRLRPDPQGPVEFLDAFWRFPVTSPVPGLVPPILIYADLMASMESRNLEAARQVRDELIDHVDHPG